MTGKGRVSGALLSNGEVIEVDFVIVGIGVTPSAILAEAAGLQIAGLNAGYDQIVTRKGESDAVSFWYYKSDALLALEAINDTRAYMIGKRLIEDGKLPDLALIANPAVDIKTLWKG